MAMHSTHDVIILGGGLVGITLAIALDAHGLSSAIVDPAPPATTLAPGFDGRASAVASAPWRMLKAIGVADRLEGQGCPIAAIRVSDGLAPGGLVFDPAPEDGAVGMSSGLTYVPGMFATDEELGQLCEVVKKYGGYYCPHTRSYGKGGCQEFNLQSR